MANMNLRLGWRKGYAPLAGLASSFTVVPDLQILSGYENSGALYINEPTKGVAGPSLGLSAIEFNQGTPIQRAVSRTNYFFTGTPNALHAIAIFRLASLVDDTVIWALVPSTTMASIRGVFRLRLTQTDRGFGTRWYFVFERVNTSGTTTFQLWSSDSYDIVAPNWFHVITSLPYNIGALYVDMYVNTVLSSSALMGTELAANGGSPLLNTALFTVLADDDQYDGIGGQTEGARRFAGRFAFFAISTSSLSASDTSTGEFSQEMANKLYGTAFNWASPMSHISQPKKAFSSRRMGLAASNQLRLGFC